MCEVETNQISQKTGLVPVFAFYGAPCTNHNLPTEKVVDILRMSPGMLSMAERNYLCLVIQYT